MHIYLSMYMCICKYLYIYIHKSVHLYANKNAYIYTLIYIKCILYTVYYIYYNVYYILYIFCRCIYIYMYMYIYIYMCMCERVCACKNSLVKIGTWSFSLTASLREITRDTWRFPHLLRAALPVFRLHFCRRVIQWLTPGHPACTLSTLAESRGRCQSNSEWWTGKQLHGMFNFALIRSRSFT